MSYNIHITRAESYLEEKEPITLEEIERLLNPLPHGFTVERSGIVTAVSPHGQLCAEVGPYLIYEDENDRHSRVHIYFDAATGPWFCVQEEKYMLPIIELAELLHAKVQGDEEEIYTRASICNSSNELPFE